ncbi:MAG TPA: aldo/keto reductase [Rhodanobacteraceae bacterium]
MNVSGLGFGTAPIGNLYAEVGEVEARAALQCALERGIGYFDTAPYYGHGLAERRLGQALAGVARDMFAVSTKVGRLIQADASVQSPVTDGFAVHGSRAVFDYSRDGVRRSFDASLARLGLDHVDILYLHDVGRLTHGANHAAMLKQALDEALPAMAALRDAGVVGAIGIGVNEIEVCLELLPKFDLDCIMLAGRYTLFEPFAARGLLAQAQRRGVRIIVAGPYNSGLLANAQHPGDTYNYAPADVATLARARAIYAACAAARMDVGAAALQLPLAHPAVAAVVAGMRSVAEVENAVARLAQPIDDAAWLQLKAAGILPADIPVPVLENLS